MNRPRFIIYTLKSLVIAYLIACPFGRQFGVVRVRQVIGRFLVLPGTKGIRTGHSIPLHYEPGSCGRGTVVADVFHRVGIRPVLEKTTTGVPYHATQATVT